MALGKVLIGVGALGCLAGAAYLAYWKRQQEKAGQAEYEARLRDIVARQLQRELGLDQPPVFSMARQS